MKTFTKILCGLALCLVALLPARADVSKPFDVGVTNVLASSATQTSNMGSVIDIRNWDNVSLLMSIGRSLSTNVSGNITITFARTIDDPTTAAARWETTPRFTFVGAVAAANDTLPMVCVTNLAKDFISGITGLKAISIQNGASGVMTNVVLAVTGKTRSK